MEASKRASERPADRGHFLFVRRRRPGRRSETDCGSSKFCDKTNRKAASRGSGPERGYWWQGTRRKVGGDIRESDYARFLAGGANRTSSRQLRCTALCARASLDAAEQRDGGHILRFAGGGARRMGNGCTNYRSRSCARAPGNERRFWAGAASRAKR